MTKGKIKFPNICNFPFSTMLLNVICCRGVRKRHKASVCILNQCKVWFTRSVTFRKVCFEQYLHFPHCFESSPVANTSNVVCIKADVQSRHSQETSQGVLFKQNSSAAAVTRLHVNIAVPDPSCIVPFIFMRIRRSFTTLKVVCIYLQIVSRKACSFA